MLLHRPQTSPRSAPTPADHVALAQLRARLAAGPGPLEKGLLSESLQALARTGSPSVQRDATSLLAQLHGAGPLRQGLRPPHLPARETPKTAATPTKPEEGALPYPPQLVDSITEHPLLRGLDPALRASLQAVSARIIEDTTTRPAEEDLRLLAFFANMPTERDLGGMPSARAVWRMWSALHRVALRMPCAPAERAVLARLLRMYQGYYATALLNAYYRAQPDRSEAYAALLERAMLQALAQPHAPQAVHTGYPGHAVVMRLAVSHNATHDGETGDAYRQDQAAIWRALGSAAAEEVVGASRGGPLRLGSVYHDVKTPQGLEHLLTPRTCLVHRGPRRGLLAVSTCDGPVAHLAPAQLPEHLEALGRTPVPNTLKVTLHNGGAGAALLPDGRTKTYDRRILLPLHSAARQLATLQQAAAQDMVSALAALQDTLGYHAEDRASLALSPSLSAQHLGNCTVHSQKLFLHYELQHLGESDTPLSAQQGEELFARLWPALLDDALQRAHRTADPGDAHARSLLARAAAALEVHAVKGRAASRGAP